MSIVDFLEQANILDFHVLLVGLSNGWCEKRSLVEYAEGMLCQAAGESDSELVTLASGGNCSDEELISIGLHFLERHGQTLSEEMRLDALDKWRYAHMSCLLHKDNSAEEKITELQELYAQFGFPDDMASCSIYSRDGIDPLVAANDVIKKLSGGFNHPAP